MENTALAEKPVEPIKLDLGCGQNKQAGFKGVDIANCDGVDFVHDLRVTPWPFENESVSEIVSSHFFEHLTAKERIQFMEECWRILVPEGKLQIVVPHGQSHRFYQDPTHQWPPLFAESFLYYDRDWIISQKLDHQHNYKCSFNFGWGCTFGTDEFGNSIQTRNESFQRMAVHYYWQASADLVMNLIKKEMK